jgi:hypothetical protein
MPSRMRNDEEEEDPPSSRRIGVGLSVEEALDEIEVELFLFKQQTTLITTTTASSSSTTTRPLVLLSLRLLFGR